MRGTALTWKVANWPDAASYIMNWKKFTHADNNIQTEYNDFFEHPRKYTHKKR
jgi:hypothetical protein